MKGAELRQTLVLPSHLAMGRALLGTRSGLHNIWAGLGRNHSEAIALPSSDILTSTEVGQWTRQNGFCDSPPNASLWRKARGIARIRPYGVASHNDGYGVLNWSRSRTHRPSPLIQ